MIVRDKPTVWDLLTALRGSVVPQILRPVGFLVLFALAMVAVDHRWHILPRLDGSAFAIFGIGLSLFLGFRNNAAYDRWWEARRLWGGLLADLRSLAREAEVFLPDPPAREKLLRGALVFLHCHRLNLRRRPAGPGDLPAVRALAGTAHPPCAALDAMNDLVAQALRDGRLDGFGARTLSTRLASMALQQAGCERIAGTPLPFVYSLLIYRTVFMYCLLLPLALNATTGWMTPVFAGVVAYMFLGLAEVSEDLSHPFSESQNGIALDALCRAAEISLAPHLGEAPPPPLVPQRHYLS